MNNYQPKINQTQQYSDDQGEHIVHKGRLLLVSNQNEGKIAIGKSTESKKAVTPDNKVGLHQTGQWDFYNPIIISETERIQKGDKVYGGLGDSFKIHEIKMEEDESYKPGYFSSYKILALPEQLSPKHLQAIVDGKMKDGDNVYLKVEQWNIGGGLGLAHKQSKQTFYKIDLGFPKNHITLFPVKQSLEEVADIWSTNTINVHPADSYIAKKAFIAGAEWAKKNNY